MVKEPVAYASVDKACGKCGSKDVRYKYMNNVKTTKIEQPRYQCFTCKVSFTLGYHNRPKHGHYQKKKGIDPEELRGLDRKCSECGDVNNAVFKFYNNKRTVGKEQPRFKCLSCGERFSMRFDGERLLPSKSVKRVKRAPRSPQAPALPSPRIVDDPYMSSTSSESCEYDMENVEQTNQFSSTEEWVSYDASVPMEQCYDGGHCSYTEEQCYDGGQCSYTEEQCYDSGQCSYIEEMEAAATMSPYYMIPNDNVASASAYYATFNAGREEQFYITDDQVYCQASVQMEQSDVEYKYSCAYEYDVINAEQGDQFSNTDDWVDQSDGGQCSYTEEVVAAAGIPSQVPNDDAASACEYEVVNGDQQVDQVSNTDAFPVEQSAVGQYPTEEMKAAAVLFPVPDDMVYSEEFEEDPDLSFREDASNLWNSL